MDTAKKNTHGKDAQGLAREARQWVASAKGREAVSQALRTAEEVTAQLSRARQVDSKTLHEPVTI